MKYDDLAKKFISCGCEFLRSAKGSHRIWRNRINGHRASIPDHGSEDLGKGIIEDVRKKLGIAKEDFDKA